ncbi:hypothetical protein LCGC14_2244400, partial [marine sediment metagenome]
TDGLDGIGAGVEGQVVFLKPTAGKDITLVHDGTVTTGKKLMLSGAAATQLGEDWHFVIAVYDATAMVWNVSVPFNIQQPAPAGDLGGSWANTSVNATHGGTHAVGVGGTGASSLTNGAVLVGNAANAIEALALPAEEGDGDFSDRFLRGDKTANVSPSWKGIEQKVSMTVETPAAGDLLIISYFTEAATIREINVTRRGGTSVTWNLYQDANSSTLTTKVMSSNQTTSTENTVTRYVPDDTAAIAAGDFLSLKIISQVGDPTQFHITVRYTTT